MRIATACMLAVVGLTGSLVYAEDESSVGVSPAPKVVQEVGQADVFYQPTRWPIFGASSSDNEACASNLRANYSGKYKNETHPRSYPAATMQPILAKSVDLQKLGFDGYRKTAKVIISWTVRAEAYQSLINPWTNQPRLCSPWHGSIEESFPGGELVTELFVNGSPVGGEFSMTFPPLGKGATYNASDPTITGSVVLTPKDFRGEFPSVLNCEIRWVNRTTGAQVKTPAFMRNMTFFMMPVTEQ